MIYFSVSCIMSSTSRSNFETLISVDFSYRCFVIFCRNVSVNRSLIPFVRIIRIACNISRTPCLCDQYQAWRAQWYIFNWYLYQQMANVLFATLFSSFIFLWIMDDEVFFFTSRLFINVSVRKKEILLYIRLSYFCWICWQANILSSTYLNI